MSDQPIDPYVPNRGNPGYRVRHYDLELEYRVSSNRLSGKARITARQVDLFSGTPGEISVVHDFSFTTRLDIDADTVKLTPLLSY